MISKKLQEGLPFASKPKNKPGRKRPSLDVRRAVVMEPGERKALAIVQQLKLMNKVKVIVLEVYYHGTSLVLLITMDFGTVDKKNTDD